MGLVVVKLLKDLIRHEGVTVVYDQHDPNMFELADDVYTLGNGMVNSRRLLRRCLNRRGWCSDDLCGKPGENL